MKEKDEKHFDHVEQYFSSENMGTTHLLILIRVDFISTTMLISRVSRSMRGCKLFWCQLVRKILFEKMAHQQYKLQQFNKIFKLKVIQFFSALGNSGRTPGHVLPILHIPDVYKHCSHDLRKEPKQCFTWKTTL